MDISNVGSFCVWSEGSATHFPVPLCIEKLALKRQNFYMNVLGVAFGFGLLGR